MKNHEDALMNGISRETYNEMDQDAKLGVLFDYVKGSHECACSLEKRMGDLEKKVDRRKWFDTKISAGTGFLGGAAAFFASKLWGSK